MAGWLSVVLVLLWALTPCQAQTGVQYIQTVPDGALYRWEYYFVNTVTLPVGGSVTISGLHHVQSAAATPAPQWSATYTSSTVTFTWNGPGDLTPPAGPPPSGYFSYTSPSSNPADMAWAGTNGESGTTTGAAPVEAGVQVYDNWISFGAFTPVMGTAAAPQAVIASGSKASDWPPTATIPAVGAYDVGYVQINTPRRLNMYVSLGGHLTRCTATGGTFDGIDTRKSMAGPYELATQWKVAFYGRFLDPLGSTYISPTSGQATNFGTWTNWSPAGNNPVVNDGWLWPSETDAWTGQLGHTIPGYPTVPTLELVVERNQYPGSITGDAAGLCIIHRVLRRGQQDVEGNYRQVIAIDLTYAE